jgi:hypothetical protein
MKRTVRVGSLIHFQNNKKKKQERKKMYRKKRAFVTYYNQNYNNGALFERERENYPKGTTEASAHILRLSHCH